MISYILYTSRGRISILCAHFLFFCVRYICDTHIYTDVKNIGFVYIYEKKTALYY